MKGLVLRWVLNAAALFIVAWLIPGIKLEGIEAALITALVLGIVNAFVRPLVVLFTLPLNIMTLGLFSLVINALMLWLAASAVGGFAVEGPFAAFFGAIILSVVSSVLSSLVLDKSGRRR